VPYISVFILVSSISYRYTSTGLATVVFFFLFFIGATVRTRVVGCRVFMKLFYEQIKWWWWMMIERWG